MKIAIGSDHRGVVYKEGIIQGLSEYKWIDVGTSSPDRCNYPVYAKHVVQKIQSKEAECGVLLCASGVGMSIAANRFPQMYAALVWNVELAQLAKQHNNANILVVPSDFVSLEMAQQMVKAWCQAEFLGGRHQERIEIIDTFL